MAAGAVPPLLLVPIYNYICFGGVINFGYHNLALPEFQDMNKGLFGITFPPKAYSAYVILFSPSRGLFFWTPFFVLAIVGLRLFWTHFRPLFYVTTGIIVVHTLCISGYFMPDGGWALGPRHLAVIIPFWGLCAGFGLFVTPNLGFLLGAYSVVLTGTATVISALEPNDSANPLISFYLPRLLQSEFRETIFSGLGLSQSGGGLLFLGVLLAVILYLYATAHFESNQPAARPSSTPPDR
jgi:hypothetical protein